MGPAYPPKVQYLGLTRGLTVNIIRMYVRKDAEGSRTPRNDLGLAPRHKRPAARGLAGALLCHDSLPAPVRTVRELFQLEMRG